MKIVERRAMPMMVKPRGHSWLLMILVMTAVLLPALPLPAQDAGFVVVINAENPVTSAEAKTVGKMFLKKIKRWPDSDVAVVPVDQGEKSEVRDAFTREVHGKRVSAIKIFWQRMIFSGRDVPPDELGSDTAVLAFVVATPGGIGYVSAGADLGDGVKVLTLTE